MPPVFKTADSQTADQETVDTPTVPRRAGIRRLFSRRLPSAVMLLLFAVLQVLIVVVAFLGGYFINGL